LDSKRSHQSDYKPQTNNFVSTATSKEPEMKAKIAVATVSGKAYYFIVNELKRKKLPFLSLKPTDKIPVDIKVVITTEKEQQQVTHPNKVLYKEDLDPIQIVAEAERIIRGKTSYDKIIIGIDPGKTFGLAMLGDGKIIETANSPSDEETFRIVMDIVKRNPTNSLIIRVGDSAPTYAKNLLRLLEQKLPKNVIVEMVSEAGTTSLSNELPNRKEARDVISAIKIAGRFGRPISRREENEQNS
jgi:hypothetical protein